MTDEQSDVEEVEEERPDTIGVVQESGFVTLRWDGPREELTFPPQTADSLAFNILGASKDAEIVRALHKAMSDPDPGDVDGGEE